MALYRNEDNFWESKSDIGLAQCMTENPVAVAVPDNPATFSNPIPVPVPAKYWPDLAGFYLISK